MKHKLNEHEIAILYMMKLIKTADNGNLIEVFDGAQIIEYFLGLDILYDFEKQELVEITDNTYTRSKNACSRGHFCDAEREDNAPQLAADHTQKAGDAGPALRHYTQYKITEKGRELCELYEKKLPEQFRARIEKCCEALQN